MEGWRGGGVGRDERAELRTRAFLYWLAEQHKEAEEARKRGLETISISRISTISSRLSCLTLYTDSRMANPAEALRCSGNDAFGAGDFRAAEEMYTQALELDVDSPVAQSVRLQPSPQ